MSASVRRVGSQSAMLAVLAVLAVLVTACTASPAPITSATATPQVSDSATAPAPAADPALVPGGSAEDNKAYFDFVNSKVIAASSSAKGRDFVDALVAAGFDKTQMQLTADATSIGLDADSVQFSVKVGDSCLIGQYGPASGGYHGVVAMPIATGACLIGQTVTID